MSAKSVWASRWAGLDRIGRDLASPVIESRRSRNQASWADRDNWILGHYFGPDDTRLWVPRRDRDGGPHSSDRVVNFSHPLGRKAFRVLCLLYLIGGSFMILVAMASLGVRW